MRLTLDGEGRRRATPASLALAAARAGPGRLIQGGIGAARPK